jgi:hypothetical protein
MSRAWIAGALVLACRGASVSAPEVVDAPVVATTRPSRPERAVGWEPLVAYREAALAVPANPDAVACDAAAEAAARAGVLDVAAYWRGEARRLAPTPAREQAWQAARVEAGFDAPAPFLAPLGPALAGALRTAVEGHAWDEVLELAEPALATAPHHELYLWAGDALWQQGREAAARRMWSRARVLLRAAKVPLRLRRPDTQRVSQLVWSPAGLAYFREEKRATFLEVQGERAERPWRRWQVPGRSALAWSRSVLAAARGSTLTLHDPASGVVLAETVAHDVPIGFLAAAADAPVFATEGWGGEIRVWRRTFAGLEMVRAVATNNRVARLALDPAGTRLAILRSDTAIELISLANGAGRSITLMQRGPTHLRFVDERVLLVGHDGGRVTRIELADDGSSTQAVRTDAEPTLFSPAGEPPQISAVSVSTRCAFAHECHWRRVVPAETVAAPDGTRRAVAQNGGIGLVDPAAGNAAILPPKVSVKIAAINHDGGSVAVAGERGVAVWDARTGAKLLARDGGRFLGFSSDGREAAIAGAPGVELHRLAGGDPAVLRGEYRAHALRWSPDGRRVAIAAGNQLAVWDLAAAAPLWTVEFVRPVLQLEFTAAGDLVYETLGVLHVRAADGSRAPRRLLGGRDVDSWSVAPDGTELLACLGRDAGAQLVDLNTLRAGRRLRGMCHPWFVDADTVFVTRGMDARVMDLRGGASTELDWALFLSHATQTNGVVFAARLERLDERLMIAARDGRKLATVVPRAELGWYVVTEHGAVDGDPGALATMETEVGADPTLQRYPAVLAWDGVHVPGLLPRVFAGEDVRPPRIH